MKNERRTSCTKRAIDLVTVFILCISLWVINEQRKLDKILNQPICTAEINLIKTGQDGVGNVHGIYITINNVGKHVAKDVSCQWDFYTVESDEKKNIFESHKDKRKIAGFPGGSRKLSLVSNHGSKLLAGFTQERGLTELVDGYDKAIEVEILLEYVDLNDETQKDTFTYWITSLQADSETGRNFDILSVEI